MCDGDSSDTRMEPPAESAEKSRQLDPMLGLKRRRGVSGLLSRSACAVSGIQAAAERASPSERTTSCAKGARPLLGCYWWRRTLK